MESLKTYFSNSIREMYPALDEKFVMGTALADKVLLRQVPSQEFAANKHLEGFWLVNTIAATANISEEDNSSRKGNCLTELKGMGMVRWGIRRQVKFLERHKENINGNIQSSSSFSQGSKKTIEVMRKPEEDEDGDEDDNEDEEEDEEDEEEEKYDEDDDEREEDNEVMDVENEETEAEDETQETKRNLKRKRYKLRNSTIRQKAKKVKREKKKKQKKTHGKRGRNKCRELLVMQNPKDRWSTDR